MEQFFFVNLIPVIYKYSFISYFRERTLAATGIGKNTLQRIRKEGQKVRANVATTSFTTPTKKRPSHKIVLSPGNIYDIKNIIYEFFTIEKRSPTVRGKY